MIAIIEAIICQERGVNSEFLHQKNRLREITETRQIIVYFTRQKTSLSLCQIGKYFGLNHATIVHSINVVNDHISTEPDFRKRIEGYQEKIDHFEDQDIDNTLFAAEVLKIEIKNLKRQVSEKELELYRIEQKIKQIN